MAEIGPIFLTAGACGLYLGIDRRNVRKHLGIPDCFVRISWREDPVWLRSRVLPKPDDVWIEEKDDGKVLWTLIEAAKRIGITRIVAFRKLPAPVGTLKIAGKNAYLWRESQIVALAKAIGIGEVKVQSRSLKAPRFGACISEARHYLASDQSIEESRVRNARRESEFFAKLL